MTYDMMLQSDHEKQSRRASQSVGVDGQVVGPSWASKEIASLDTGKDFSLKDGETIRSAKFAALTRPHTMNVHSWLPSEIAASRPWVILPVCLLVG